MSSGVRFREEYTGTDDVSRLVANTYPHLKRKRQACRTSLVPPVGSVLRNV